MFTDAILAVIALALLVERFLAENRWTTERERLVNRIIAKTPSEVRLLDAPHRDLPRQPDPMADLEGYLRGSAVDREKKIKAEKEAQDEDADVEVEASDIEESAA